jgi:uncharacterized membrane protein
VGILVLIGVITVIRRIFQLSPSPEPPRFPEAAAMDRGFFQHPRLTLMHILPGFLFMVLGPLQFLPQLRRRRLELHRWSGRVFIAAGAVIGISALIMSPQMAIGGANETVATMLFALLFLFALGKAFLHIRRRQVAQHREWMIRAFAIGLAVATIRPIVGVFFATSRLTHLTPQQFFGTAFWLGFTLHAIAAEIWINYTRPHVRGSASPSFGGCLRHEIEG